MTETYNDGNFATTAAGTENQQTRDKRADPRGAPDGRSPETEELGIHDPLVECLADISARLGSRVSSQTLIAGLPMPDGRLPVEHVPIAADRAGLVAEIRASKLRRLRDVELPVILLLKDGRAAVLEGLSRDRKTAKIREPGGDAASTADLIERAQDLKDLERRYDGRLIALRPVSSSRAEEQGGDSGKEWFWSAFRPNAGLYGQVFVMTMIVNLFSLAVPLFIMNVYDRVVPNAAVNTLWALAIGVLIAAALDFVLRTLRTYVIDVAGRRADVQLATNLYSRVLGARLEVRSRSAGAQANVLREYETLRDFFNSATLATFGDLIFIFLFIVVIWLVAGRLALVPAITVPVVITVALLTQIPLRKIAKRSFREASQKNAVLFETLGGIETIKAVGGEGWAADKWERSVAETIRTGMKSRFFAAINVHAVAAAQIVSTVFIVVLGVYDIQAGTLTTGALIAAVILNGRVIAPLGQVASVFSRMYQAIVAFGAVNALMKAPQERRRGGQFIELRDCKGEIELNDVEFAYPEEQDNALRGISLGIKAGEHVGIVGPVGSGKSTILKLILGLYRPRHGLIRLDGVDLAELDPAVVRTNIGYVPQGSSFFRGSVRENLTIHAPFADDAQLLQAAQLSGLADWLRNAPRGFDTPVGEQGQELSGGQRQSVALARALLLQPRILLLDEPTTGLDRRAATTLAERLRKAGQDRTMVVVSHSQPALSLVDRLIVVEGGRVTADGAKDQITEYLAERQAQAASRKRGEGRKTES